MKYFFSGIVLMLLVIGFLSLFSYGTVCQQTLRYSLGEFDQGFGITQEDFLASTEVAEFVWEDYTGTNLFQYDPDASFTINLVFDERQQNTNTNTKLQEEISQAYSKYDNKKTSLEKLQNQYDQKESSYEKAVEDFNERKEKYDADVAYWNNQGGATQDQYQELQKEYQYLENEFNRLEKIRQDLNIIGSELNEAIQEVNIFAQRHNSLVEQYTKMFGDAEGFDQGLYTGNAITIYQFTDTRELEFVLAHELGHALGIDHVGDPSAIMFYLMNDQRDLSLTEDDKQALGELCREDLPWHQKIFFNTDSTLFHYGKKIIHAIL